MSLLRRLSPLTRQCTGSIRCLASYESPTETFLPKEKVGNYGTLMSTNMGGFSFPGARSLSEVVKLPLLQRESPEDVKMIWETQHAEAPTAVGRVMSVQEFSLFRQRAGRSPFFVFPVRRDKTNFFNLVSNFQDKYVLYTFMEEYQRNPATAQPWFAVTFFEELAKDKDLVLVRGDFTHHIFKLEAQRLLDLTLNFHLDTRKYASVETFNHRPRDFDFNKHLSDCP